MDEMACKSINNVGFSVAYFALYNTLKQWQPGWVPSQSDLFAMDWCCIYD